MVYAFKPQELGVPKTKAQISNLNQKGDMSYKKAGCNACIVYILNTSESFHAKTGRWKVAKRGW